MTTLRFRPGPDFLSNAAAATWHFLDCCGDTAGGAHIVVPTAAQIPAVRQALDTAARGAGRPRLLPRVLTLGHWLLDLPPRLLYGDRPVRTPAARLLAVQQALRGQEWLRRAFGAQTEPAAWGMAQTLLSVCDELSARWLEDSAIRDDEDVVGDDRAALLQGALERTYAHLSARLLGEEARIVMAFWQALSGPDDPLPARRRALHLLAGHQTGPVVWLAPTPPQPIDAAFLRAAAELVPVLEIGYDWTLSEDGTGPEAGAVAWGSGAPGGDDSLACASASGTSDDGAGADSLPLPSDCADAWHAALLRLWPECRLPAPPAAPPGLARLPAATLEAGVLPRVRVIGSARFEDEAVAAADQLVQWLNAGRSQLALVAHDRVVARRVRALLARAGAPVRDETGWKLSTTRAAAALMRWFDLAGKDGDVAALLDLVKSPFCLPDLALRGEAIAAIERRVRRDGITGGWSRLRHRFQRRADRPSAGPADDGAGNADAAEVAAAAAHTAACDLIARLADEAGRWPRGGAQRPVGDWLALLDGSLDALGMRAPLAADDAGSQLLDALARLAELPRDEAGAAATLDFAEFRAMLSALLESVSYKEPSAGGSSRITILPLNGARMRRFDGVVVVGCDDSQLPSAASELMFFSNQMRRELGLEDREARFAQQARDLAEVLLNNDDVVLTWQRQGSRGEPRHVSGWIERLIAACARAGVNIEASASMPWHETVATPGGMPAPHAEHDLVPERWSAQAYNMLRRCPYQFFAGRLLGLAGLEAVNDDLEKRDIGDLLHQILLRFHKETAETAQHAGPGDAAAQWRLTRLREISDDVFGALMAEDGNAIGYYRRWLDVLPSYIAWQTAREAHGWRWQGGEIEAGVDLPMPDGQPLRLHGRIDRLDRGPDGERAVLDYKTQTLSRLKRRARDVEEDCQLPFYGLLRADAVAGSWVSLEGAETGGEIAQREVAMDDFDRTVAWLARQLRDDVTRLREGAPLPAFGDASACAYCTARGLCRKGFWESTALPANVKVEGSRG